MSGDDESLARAEARVGVVLKDKWRLDSLIGVGGMAAVYASTHRNKNRVAVKMLHAQFSGDETVRSRFLREGYLANTVEHVGAVKVLDDDVSEDGAAFLVMELLDGETIDARWARKGNRLDASEVLVIADKLLDALSAAHDKGIVHRDIKPENLFLTREGTLKILDFGIARIFEGTRDPKGTKQGYIMGTPAFMSPEQALGHWDDVDGRTDIWAVGATMFTLITGRYVHEARSGNEQLIRSATAPAASIGAVQAGLSPEVIELVDRALAFEKEARWADARTMRRALRAAYQALRGGGAAEAPRASAPSLAAVVPAAPPPVDPAAVEAQLAARTAERDARASELAAATAPVTELRARLAASRRTVGDLQQRVLDAKNERAALDEQFRRQTTSKSAGVGEARKVVNESLLHFATLALADAKTFGPEFDLARADVDRLAKAATARAHDVEVCGAAIGAYDPEGLRRGMFAVGLAIGLVVLLFAVPFVWRGMSDPAPAARTPPASEGTAAP